MYTSSLCIQPDVMLFAAIFVCWKTKLSVVSGDTMETKNTITQWRATLCPQTSRLWVCMENHFSLTEPMKQQIEAVLRLLHTRGDFFTRLIQTKIYFFKLLFVLLVNPHRTRILRGEKTNLLFFRSRSIFPNICPANKRINQSQRLCRADVMSVSNNNNINNNSCQAHPPCLLAPGVVW